LQEDEGRAANEWQSAREYDDRDDKTNDWIEIEFELPFREPDDKACGNNSDVPQCISEDMQEESVHVHGAAMGVRMT